MTPSETTEVAEAEVEDQRFIKQVVAHYGKGVIAARKVSDAYTAVNVAITIAREVGIDAEQFLELVRANWEPNEQTPRRQQQPSDPRQLELDEA